MPSVDGDIAGEPGIAGDGDVTSLGANVSMKGHNTPRISLRIIRTVGGRIYGRQIDGTRCPARATGGRDGDFTGVQDAVAVSVEVHIATTTIRVRGRGIERQWSIVIPIGKIFA